MSDAQPESAEGAADVFISYSRRDSDKVAELVERLQGHGVKVWLDQEGIDAATRWSEEIVNAITACKVFLFVASVTSFESENVATELSIAAEERKPILPIYLEPVTVPASIRYQLAGIQHQELYGKGEAKAFENILRALGKQGVGTRGRPGAETRPAARAFPALRLTLLLALLLAVALGLRSNLPGWATPATVASIALLALALPPLARWTWRAARRRASEDFRTTLAGGFGALLTWPALTLFGVCALVSFTDDVLPEVEAKESCGLLVRVPIPTTTGLALRVYLVSGTDESRTEELLAEQDTGGKDWVYLPGPGQDPALLDPELEDLIAQSGGDRGKGYEWGPELDLGPDDRLKVHLFMLDPPLLASKEEFFDVSSARRALGSHSVIPLMLED